MPAALFRENLRYADRTPVRVVIADTTIGRVGETGAANFAVDVHALGLPQTQASGKVGR